MSASSHSAVPGWLQTALPVLLLLVCVNLLSHRGVDPDLWGHIQYGEEWIASGELARTATHTYSAPDYRWINHENLSELALAAAQRTVGGTGIMLLRTLAGVLVLGLMIRAARRQGVTAAAAIVFLLPVSHALAEFWVARPQLASFLCFAGMILLLDSAFRGWHETGAVRKGPLFALIPLMIVWVNAHGGFAAGLCILAAYLGLRLIESFVRYRTQFTGHLMLFSSVGLLCLATIVVNPYGVQLPLWMLESLGQPRPEIAEWKPMIAGGRTLVPFTVLTGLCLFGVIRTTRRRDPVQLVILGLVTAQAWLHLRHLAFEAILAGFWITPHVVSAWTRLRSRSSAPEEDSTATPPAGRMAGIVLGLQCLLIGIGLAGYFGWKQWTFGVDRSDYPVAAVEFIHEQQMEGRLVASFDWAQYALSALSPQMTVSLDGRFRTCYPQHVIDMNFDFTNGPRASNRFRDSEEGAVDRVLEFGNPNVVLLDRREDFAGIRVISEHPEWTLLFQDGISQVWGRSSIYNVAASRFYVPPGSRIISDDVPTGFTKWPAFPGRSGRLAFHEGIPPESRLSQQHRVAEFADQDGQQASAL